MVNWSIINQSIIDSINIIFGLHVPLIYILAYAKYKKNSSEGSWDMSHNVPIVDRPQTTDEKLWHKLRLSFAPSWAKNRTNGPVGYRSCYKHNKYKLQIFSHSAINCHLPKFERYGWVIIGEFCVWCPQLVKLTFNTIKHSPCGPNWAPFCCTTNRFRDICDGRLKWVIIGEFCVRYPEFVKLTLLILNNALRVQIELFFLYGQPFQRYL